MQKKTKVIGFIVAGALALAAIVGVVGYKTVYAQTGTPTAPDGTTAPFAGRGMKDGFRGGVTDEALAEALGVTVEELQAAQKTASDEALKAAVSQGLITQEQADAITARGNGFGGRFFGEANGIDYQALLAKALGISEEKLESAMNQVFDANLAQAVSDGKLTQEQADLMKAQRALVSSDKFQTSMQSAYEAAVQQAVTDGVITQAQADALLSQPRGPWGGKGGFGGLDGFGGRGGHGGRGRGPGLEGTPPEAAPTTTGPTS